MSVTGGGFVSFISIEWVAAKEELTNIASDAMAYGKTATRVDIYKFSDVKYKVIEDDKFFSILNSSIKNVSGHWVWVIFESEGNLFVESNSVD